QDQVPVLDQPQARRDPGGLDGGRRGAPRLLVAALRPVACETLGEAGSRARARRKARRHRGRPGELRKGRRLIAGARSCWFDTKDLIMTQFLTPSGWAQSRGNEVAAI